MILADTSVWIDHFRRGNDRLTSLLEAEEVLVHQFVIGELACGSLKNRGEILSLLGQLPTAVMADPDEVLAFIDAHRLMGRGLGYVDVHLLASVRLQDAALWTLDARLGDAATRLGVTAS